MTHLRRTVILSTLLLLSTSLTLPACLGEGPVDPGFEQTALDRSPSPAPDPTVDYDGDGVPNPDDFCPLAGRGPAVGEGCTALQIAQQNHRLVDRVDEAVRRAATTIDEVDEKIASVSLDDLVTPLTDVLDRRAPTLVGRVDAHASCGLAEAYQEVLGELELLQVAVGNRVEREQANLGLRAGEESGDFSIDWVTLHMVGTQLAEAVEVVANTQALLTGACAANAGARSLRGARIAELDEVNRTITLLDGTHLAISDSVLEDNFYPGAELSGGAEMFSDNVTGMLTHASVVLYNPGAVGPSIACLKLRIAPIQPFASWVEPGEYGADYGRAGLQPPTGDYVLHEPDAYAMAMDLGSGQPILHLERGMRLGVASTCPEPSQTEDHYRYSIRVKFQHSGGVVPMAYNLTPDSPPAPFPINTPSNGTLIVEHRYQWCEVEGGSTTCSSPQLQFTSTRLAQVFDRGDLCAAEYNQDTFSVEHQPLGYSELANVATVDLYEDPPFASMGQVYFHATGFSQATQPLGSNQVLASYASVFGIESFPIFGWEPSVYLPEPKSGFGYPTMDVAALGLAGSLRPSGLRFPRVVGYRNGDQFAYSCTLPKIVRDRVSTCSGSSYCGLAPYNNPDTFYRVPFEHLTTTSVGQGNCAGFTHKGTQRFAFDLQGNEWRPIHAARGGLVVDLMESEWREDCAESSQPCGPGFVQPNFVLLRHQDDSFGLYAHMPQYGVTVSVGQVVRRGWKIGYVGNTGNSTGPHLHFHEQTNMGITSRLSFDAGLTCIIPDDGDGLFTYNPLTTGIGIGPPAYE